MESDIKMGVSNPIHEGDTEQALAYMARSFNTLNKWHNILLRLQH